MLRGVAGGPANHELFNGLSFGQADEDGGRVLGGQPFPTGLLEGSLPQVGVGGYEGADGIAVADRASEVEPDAAAPPPKGLELVAKDAEARGVSTGKGDVNPAILVVIEERKRTGIFPAVDAADQRAVMEGPFLRNEKSVSLVSAQRIAQVGRAAGLRLPDAELKIEKGGLPGR